MNIQELRNIEEKNVVSRRKTRNVVVELQVSCSGNVARYWCHSTRGIHKRSDIKGCPPRSLLVFFNHNFALRLSDSRWMDCPVCQRKLRWGHSHCGRWRSSMFEVDCVLAFITPVCHNFRRTRIYTHAYVIFSENCITLSHSPR